MRLFARHLLLFTLVLVVLAGCRAPGRKVITPVFTPTTSASATSAPFASATIPALQETLPTASPDVQELHPTEPPPAEASISPTGSPGDGRLSVRRPSEAQLEQYLPPKALFDDLLEALYQDVNGDGEEDLIVVRYTHIYFLVWAGGAYSQPFLVSEEPYEYVHEIKLSIQDWTGDSIPETIIDYYDLTGGTGLQHHRWLKKVVRCEREQCAVIWQDVVAAFAFANAPPGWVGIEYYLNQPHLLQMSENTMIAQTSSAFMMLDADGGIENYVDETIYRNPDCIDLSLCPGCCPKLNVLSSHLTLSAWDGTRVAPVYTHTLTLPHDFPRFDPEDTFIITVEAQPLEAKVVVDPGFQYVSPNKECLLLVNEKVIAASFHCYPDWSNVTWMNITSDEQPEIVVQVVAGPYDLDSQPLTAKGCLHERLLIYQQNGEEWSEIANVDGCIVRSDLFGVRLEDLDGDGVMEIIAAGEILISAEDCSRKICWWKELNNTDQVYRWDGQRFVFWKNQARE